MTPRERLAMALVDVLTTGHPYRDDIRGDITEEFAARAATSGIAAARRWRVREALRTVGALMRDAPFTPWSGARLALTVLAGYAAILGADWGIGHTAFWCRAFITPEVARVPAFLALGAVALAAGYAVARLARDPPLAAALALVGLVTAAGIHSVSAGDPTAASFHAAKAALLWGGAAFGSWRGAWRRGASAS